MSSSDEKPHHHMLTEETNLNNRLGAVLEACHTFVETRYKCADRDRVSLITISTKANRRISCRKMSDGLIMSLAQMDLRPEVNTYFSHALVEAKAVIDEVAKLIHLCLRLLLC